MESERLEKLLKDGAEKEGLLNPDTVGGLAVIADLAKDSVKILINQDKNGNIVIKSIEAKVYDVTPQDAARGAVKGVLEALDEWKKQKGGE